MQGMFPPHLSQPTHNGVNLSIRQTGMVGEQELGKLDWAKDHRLKNLKLTLSFYFQYTKLGL